MKGIFGAALPFETTPPPSGLYGFGSFGTKISSLYSPQFDPGGNYPTIGQLGGLSSYGIYIENQGFGTPFTWVGDSLGQFGTPRLLLGGIGSDAYSFSMTIFNQIYLKADVMSNYLFFALPYYSSYPQTGFYADSYTFAISAGGDGYNPQILMNYSNLTFNVNSIAVSNSSCYNNATVSGSPVKNLIIIDDTGTPRAIPMYNVPR